MELMFYIYLGCLIFGGILTGFSLLASGDDGSHDADHGLDSHDFDGHALDSGDFHGASLEAGDASDFGGHDFDAGSDFDTGHDFDAGHSLETGETDLTVHDHGEIVKYDFSETADAVKFVSFRNIIFFMTFFGLTGTVLDLIGTAAALTLGSSTGVGLASAYVGYRLMKYLRTSESGSDFSISSLKGKTGTVTLTVRKSKRGKIKVAASGQTVEILAKVSDVENDAVIDRGSEVLIIDTKENTAFVVKSDFFN